MLSNQLIDLRMKEPYRDIYTLYPYIHNITYSVNQNKIVLIPTLTPQVFLLMGKAASKRSDELVSFEPLFLFS